MCMKPEHMFLTMVIPGPSNPKRRIDVYLKPLIEELLQLWHRGVLMHDHVTNQAFMMRAILMWTFNDLPGYGMDPNGVPRVLWGVLFEEQETLHKKSAGKKDCTAEADRRWIRHRVEQYGTAVEEPLTYPPYYGNVHKWTKKSIFWDLPYWNIHLIQHNLDVMHIEKNVFDSIFNTVMDIKGKTKNNLNARKDLKNICNRPELKVDKHRPNAMPKAAAYTLMKEQKKKMCEWVMGLRFLRDLKKKVKNKTFVEASICEAYIVQEIGWFTSHYFESHVTCKGHRPSRNDELTQNNDRVARDIFNHPGRTRGVSTKRYTLGQEPHVMETYVLCKAEVVAPYYK
ncbi:UNVERIFIED_CONTAM: hypothetical protein Sradi_5416300 [Sesamum radiatum]|uniref:DUF4218 domain-containing protein n=1 Tax=Sesamum radiatum TaxID=300843 RepID=A0AAW2LB34_SESRA